MSLARASATLAASSAWLLPRLALACPTCFSATGAKGLWGYYLSTILLTTAPFALIGLVVGAAYAMRKRKRSAAGSAEDSGASIAD